MSQPPSPSKGEDRDSNERYLSRHGEGVTLVKEIRNCCANIIVRRKQCQELAMDVSALFDVLKDNVGYLTSAELQQMLDEITAILTSVYARVHEWSQYGFLQAFWRSGQVGYGLDQCEKEVRTALNKWKMSAAISLNNTRNPLVLIVMQDPEEWPKYIAGHRAELFKFTKQFLRKRPLVEEAIELHKLGHPAAERMMELSQLLLQLPIQSSNAGRAAIEYLTQEDYDSYRDRLVRFQHLTGIPPTIKLLNGQIEKLGDEPIEWGSYSQLWNGRWLGRIKVALKVNGIEALPSVKVRFDREMAVWSKLKHHNVLPFYGIATDLGPLVHIVTPWCYRGNVLQFTENNSGIDKTRLLLGAARGLQRLHAENVIHGNVRCTNILVTDEGEACICDYGMLPIYAEITSKSPSDVLMQAGYTRWMAPELAVGATLLGPNTACDVWSFGMAALECYTSHPPYAEIQSDGLVTKALYSREHPDRPQDMMAITDGVWEVLVSCWQKKPGDRPTMDEVVSHFYQIVQAMPD
ncbi:kinase-like protein [Laetiporus sulphureus 93-53]|uniref:Kinase-like protein n=1 Tax=Laetiporus sulphureus 93-53 TaxID=1314785 RepID=A0A165E376_9APHY|nr:kinase-like protein [Laetiporus sulphureus 93-53]KZT06155.1 kinase-like protein [Laetiporus sulphureus 93-53]